MRQMELRYGQMINPYIISFYFSLSPQTKWSIEIEHSRAQRHQLTHHPGHSPGVPPCKGDSIPFTFSPFSDSEYWCELAGSGEFVCKALV